VGVSSDFHLYLIRCHINSFDGVTLFLAQKVLQRTRRRKAWATSFSCHHFTLYLHCHHLLSHSLSSSQILAHPELAPSGPSASRWRTVLIPTTSSSCRRVWCGINYWPNLVSLFLLILCKFGSRDTKQVRLTKLFWHKYQLCMSNEIKYLWNHRMKFSLRVDVSSIFHFILHGMAI
jgi:hypothetical protein